VGDGGTIPLPFCEVNFSKMRRSERFPLLDRQVQLDRDPDLLGVYSVDTGYNFQMFLAVASA
jgi:hypothetical protein